MTRYTPEEMVAMANTLRQLHPSFQDAMDGAGLSLGEIADMLRQAAADGQGKCVMGVYCREHNFIHGADR